MPTGYTACLLEENPPTFPEFVLRCARAFGALIEMRDEPMDAAIPQKLGTDDFRARSLVRSRAELDRLLAFSDNERLTYGEQKKMDRKREFNASIRKRREQRERLLKMRSQVALWTPPTEQHFELKKFMLQQIEDTIDWDGKCDYLLDGLARLEQQRPLDIFNEALQGAQRSVEYNEKSLRESQDRNIERQKWIDDLRESLKMPA